MVQDDFLSDIIAMNESKESVEQEKSLYQVMPSEDMVLKQQEC